MKDLLAHPLVSRTLGALGAGVTTYAVSHDWKSALATAVTFVVYGAAHSTSTAIGDSVSSS